MRHRFDTTLDVYATTGVKGANNVIMPGITKVSTLPCKIVKTENTARTDTKPTVFVLKKIIGVPKEANILLGYEIELPGADRRYLVTDVVPHRYWQEIHVECEVKGSGLP